MRGQITVDSLITAAALLSVSVLLLSAFYVLYITAEKGIRRGHLRYLAQIIEDRLKICDVVDGTKIYAPYEVNLLCSAGKLCWHDICEDVQCNGGGSGKTFQVRGCRIIPVTG